MKMEFIFGLKSYENDRMRIGAVYVGQRMRC